MNILSVAHQLNRQHLDKRIDLLCCSECPQLVFRPAYDKKDAEISLRCYQCAKEVKMDLDKSFFNTYDDPTFNECIEILKEKWMTIP